MWERKYIYYLPWINLHDIAWNHYLHWIWACFDSQIELCNKAFILRVIDVYQNEGPDTDCMFNASPEHKSKIVSENERKSLSVKVFNAMMWIALFSLTNFSRIYWYKLFTMSLASKVWYLIWYSFFTQTTNLKCPIEYWPVNEMPLYQISKRVILFTG